MFLLIISHLFTCSKIMTSRIFCYSFTLFFVIVFNFDLSFFLSFKTISIKYIIFQIPVLKSGQQSYRQVNNYNYTDHDDFPPPPPDSFSKGYNYIEEEFPPPPPPAPPQSQTYSNGDDGHPYGNVSYGGNTRYARNEDYRPPDYDSVSSQSPRSSLNDGESRGGFY